MGLGWAAILAVVTKLRRRLPAGALGARPTTGTPIWVSRSRTSSRGADRTWSIRRTSPTLSEVAGDVRGDQPTPQGAASKGRAVRLQLLARSASPTHRQVPREGPHRRAPHGGPRGSPGGPSPPRCSTVRSTRASGPACSPATSGGLAALARDDRLEDAELALFHPLKFMLASPAEDAAEIVRRLGPTVWVEDKYDGIRCQLHSAGTTVRLYSRDLHDIGGQYPEVVRAATLAWDGDPRRRDPGLARRRRPAVHQPPDAAGAQGPSSARSAPRSR